MGRQSSMLTLSPPPLPHQPSYHRPTTQHMTGHTDCVLVTQKMILFRTYVLACTDLDSYTSRCMDTPAVAVSPMHACCSVGAVDVVAPSTAKLLHSALVGCCASKPDSRPILHHTFALDRRACDTHGWSMHELMLQSEPQWHASRARPLLRCVSEGRRPGAWRRLRRGHGHNAC